MAKKKIRTPPPPRAVQAPKRRYEPTTSGFSRRSKLIAAAIAVALAAGVTIAVAATRGGGGSGDPSTKVAAAGCTFKTYPNLGQAHV